MKLIITDEMLDSYAKDYAQFKQNGIIKLLTFEEFVSEMIHIEKVKLNANGVVVYG